jgi:hypothetical protein
MCRFRSSTQRQHTAFSQNEASRNRGLVFLGRHQDLRLKAEDPLILTKLLPPDGLNSNLRILPGLQGLA